MKLKKTLYLTLLAACLSVATAAVADEYYDEWAYEEDSVYIGQWYYISTDYDPGIAMHPVPEKDSETLIRIPYLQTFFVEEVIGNYGYTYYDGYEGWVNIGEHAEPIKDPNELDDCYYADAWYRISTKYDPGIALHPVPEKNSETLERVPYGTEIYVEYICGNYGFTYYQDYVGWINVGEHAELVESSDDYDFYDDYDDYAYNYIEDYLESYDYGVSSEYILPESSSRYLDYSDICHMTAQGLCYARNEIYARYGRKFASSELQDYFNSTSWYCGIYEADDFPYACLNAYEEANVQTLLNREKEICPGQYVLNQPGYRDGWSTLFQGNVTAAATGSSANSVSDNDVQAMKNGEIVSLGSFVSLDLNSDGITEQISLSADPSYNRHPMENEGYLSYYLLQADDQQCGEYGDNVIGDIYGVSLDGENILLIVFDEGPSDDPISRFYTYDGDSLFEIGRICSAPDNMDINEYGEITAVERCIVMDTAVIERSWEMDEYGMLVQMEQVFYNLYTPNCYYGGMVEYYAYLKYEIDVYSDMDYDSELITMEPQAVYFPYTDGYNWVYVEGEEGVGGWLEVGWMDYEERNMLFDGLIYAG